MGAEGFGRSDGSNIVLMSKQLLYEIIEKRIYETKCKMEDLFLLCKAPGGLEGEQQVDTPYGKLRVFFLKDGWRGKSWLLNKKKYPYPKISQVSSKGSHKVDLDTLTKGLLN